MARRTLLEAAMTVALVVIGLNHTAAEEATERGGSHQVSKERMQEWNDWKFGLFIHWGPWSQTGIGAIWQITRKDPPEVREKRFELYKTFNPVKFDPNEWARLAKEAGMKYVVFVTKHHDGFNNFDTRVSDFSIMNPQCPYSKSPQPDLVRRITDAFRAEGLAIGYYYSHIDWHHPDAKYFSMSHWDYDESLIATDPERWRRFVAFERAQVRELITNYGPPDVFWFDIRWPSSDGNGKPYTNPVVRRDAVEMIRMMRKTNPQMIIDNRGTDVLGDFATPEQQVPAMGMPGYWESNITISNGGGYWYRGPDTGYKPPEELVRTLIDIASKGGNFLMNVGPRPDGTIAPQEIEALKGVGKWMAVNGQSIYGTTRTAFNKLDWGRCTVKGNTLFLHVFDWPTDGLLRVPGLKTKVVKAYLLADKGRASKSVTRDRFDLLVDVGTTPPDPTASVVVLELAGPPVVDNMLRANREGVIELDTGLARLHGPNVKYYAGQGTHVGGYVENWKSHDDWVSWEFRVQKPGRFEVEILCAGPGTGGQFTLSVADQKLSGRDEKGKQAKPPARRRGTRSFVAGSVSLPEPDVYTLSIKPEKLAAENLIYLRGVRLRPMQ